MNKEVIQNGVHYKDKCKSELMAILDNVQLYYNTMEVANLTGGLFWVHFLLF